VRRLDWAKIGPQVAAPVLALIFAAALSAVLLSASGHAPGPAVQSVWGWLKQPSSIVDIINKSTSLYIAALAVAVGFKMGLFNIGVEGQYRVAGMFAAAAGGAKILGGTPGWIRILIALIVAVIVGAIWAGIAAVLKVTRGISEVIATIMLNFIGGSVVAYLLTEGKLGVKAGGANLVSTRVLPPSAQIKGFPYSGTNDRIYGMIILAALLGVAYWFVLNRTRFGYDLRASGRNPWAAQASGVNAKKMTVITLLISGGIAGLVAMPQLFGDSHAFTADIAGLGFTGIAIALLGRNHPIGIAAAAVLWATLDRASFQLDFDQIPKEITQIVQAVTVLAVVIAYQLANELSTRAQQRRVGAATGSAEVVNPAVPASVAAKEGIEVDTTIEPSDQSGVKESS
jgi:general nucleoside transport system permease protein